MANRLANAISPYLRQHADNPVDWYEWGEQAFAEARRRDVPVLVSIGYATCHWCHVMARESFSDPALAEYLNAHFVAIKIDREEHPDVDSAYLSAASAFTRNLGWPLNVFTTGEGRAFFAGTYWPPNPIPGSLSFRQVLAAVREAWTERRDDLEHQAAAIVQALSQTAPVPGALPDAAALADLAETLAQLEDREYGGFGPEPKFPMAPVLGFLLSVATPLPEATTSLPGTAARPEATPLPEALEGRHDRSSGADPSLPEAAPLPEALEGRGGARAEIPTSDARFESLNERDLNERDLNEQDLNERGLNERDLDERGLNERDLDERGLNERNLDGRGLDEREFGRGVDERDLDGRGLDVRGTELRDAHARNAEAREADARDLDERGLNERDLDGRGPGEHNLDEHDFDEWRLGVRGSELPDAHAPDRLSEDGPRALARRTLRKMAGSSLRDGVEGGFFRYATRRDWSEPHYERMLYDNAQLLRLYALAASPAPATDADTAAGIARYLLEVLRLPGGAFASAQDSESVIDGVRREGAYYRLGASERALHAPPAVDAKVLTGWNGLAIDALATAGVRLGHPEWLAAARDAAQWLLAHHRRADGSLVRASVDGRASAARATLEDYGMFATALLTLATATGEASYAATARELVDHCLIGGRFVADLDPVLAAQGTVIPPDPSEGALPSAASAMARAALTLHGLTGERRYRDAAVRAMQDVAPLAMRQPTAFGAALHIMVELASPSRQIVVVGDPDASLASLARSEFGRTGVVAVATPQQAREFAASGFGLFDDRAAGERTVAYVCSDFVCALPTSEIDELRRQLA